MTSDVCWFLLFLVFKGVDESAKGNWRRHRITRWELDANRNRFDESASGDTGQVTSVSIGPVFSPLFRNLIIDLTDKHQTVS